MLIIGTAFEILYLHGRECSPKFEDLPQLTGADVVWDTLIIHFGSPTAAIATNPYVTPSCGLANADDRFLYSSFAVSWF
jgi:hypothetical protein